MGRRFQQDAELSAWFRPQDIAACKAAAKLYNVYILMRRINEASVKYIGQPDYIPKPLDCKAKTADNDVPIGNRPRKYRGLVVDAKRVGRAAFNNWNDYQEAIDAWSDFSEKLAGDRPSLAGGRPDYRSGVSKTPGEEIWGKHYAVLTDVDHPHYLCVFRSTNLGAVRGKFIHGDYDLYGIVPADDPATNIAFKGTAMGMPHHRGKDTLDIQTYINARIGIPMVRHAEQEKYKGHSDEPVDVFFPTAES